VLPGRGRAPYGQRVCHPEAPQVRPELRDRQKIGERILVAELLATAGYSLQANRKTREGPQHPDRDAQFRYINQLVRRFQVVRQPVISVDTKKKELVGDFKNAGRQWRPKGMPAAVRVHDFLIPERGKAIPYGVYDLTRNAGWVSVGIDHCRVRKLWRGISGNCGGSRGW
jgi:DDE family transposase